jgi:hypothetical protein
MEGKPMKFEIPGVRCPYCPPGAQVEGTYYLGKSYWHFCRAHRTKWMAGWDDAIDDNKDEQGRRFNELGLEGFEHVGKEETEALTATIAEPVMPAFVFARRRDIEVEGGLLLAGNLVVDIAKGKKVKPKRQHMITALIEMLTAQVRAGQMPDDAVVYGWHGGRRPDNAADDAAIERWAQTRLICAVRVDPSDDRKVRIDSDIMWQMGLIKRQ